MYGGLVDISARKQAEAALAARAKPRFRDSSSSPTPESRFRQVDARGMCTRMPARWSNNYWVYSLEEIIGQIPLLSPLPEDGPETLQESALAGVSANGRAEAV